MTDPTSTIAVDDPAFVAEEDVDQEAYDKLLGNRIWLCLQAGMMIIYMIVGVVAYRKLIKGKYWHPSLTLFAFQTACMTYLLINEFTHRYISGIFITLLFTRYCLFLTFNIVMDSCITETQAKNWRDNKLQVLNKVFRIFMHCATAALFLSTFWMQDCNDAIYPVNFVALVVIIVAHQVHDVFLACHDYMVDWDNLPATSPDKLYNNQALFKAQMKALLIGNLLWGVIAIATVVSGYLIINDQNQEGAKQLMSCVGGNEWSYLSPLGNFFGTLHQVLILMHISGSQIILIRIPGKHGIWASAKGDTMTTGIHDRLLQNSEGDPTVETSASGDVAINAGDKADDHFRA